MQTDSSEPQRSVPIADYAFLSNCRCSALVSRAGSVDWLCFPRFDSPSIFARMLHPQGGHFSVEALNRLHITRRYCEKSLVLETTAETVQGTCRFTDALAFAHGKRGHELGEESPALLVRGVECLRGAVQFRLEMSAKAEYGLVEPVLTKEDGGIVGRAGASVVFLSLETPYSLRGGVLESVFTLNEGESSYFGLEWASSAEALPKRRTQRSLESTLADTLDGWQSWSALHQRYAGPWKDLVTHSGRVLQGLVYQPTGAIVAASTTSLPEVAGGSRNWDYRFTWVRDASITMESLWISACPFEATRFFRFLANTASAQLFQRNYLQIMFGIGGEHDLSERALGTQSMATQHISLECRKCCGSPRTAAAAIADAEGRPQSSSE